VPASVAEGFARRLRAGSHPRQPSPGGLRWSTRPPPWRGPRRPRRRPVRGWCGVQGLRPGRSPRTTAVGGCRRSAAQFGTGRGRAPGRRTRNGGGRNGWSVHREGQAPNPPAPPRRGEGAGPPVV